MATSNIAQVGVNHNCELRAAVAGTVNRVGPAIDSSAQAASALIRSPAGVALFCKVIRSITARVDQSDSGRRVPVRHQWTGALVVALRVIPRANTQSPYKQGT